MKFNRSFDPKWITERISAECITFAEELGKELCDLDDRNRSGRDGLTTAQIRNFFGEVKRIQQIGFEKQRTSFLLIKPKLAYAQARHAKNNQKHRILLFRKYMDLAHDAVTGLSEGKQPETFQRYVDFLEAVIAYHKAYGGKD